MYEAQDSRTAYNQVYDSYLKGQPTHKVSLTDLDKAKRRVRQVCRAFGISLARPKRVLDVGCGLGFFSKALEAHGANVTGIDIADVAIQLAKRSFPSCTFVRGAFPTDLDQREKFDLIWAVDLSLLNTFDIDSIQQHFIVPALARLEPNGAIVIGWHSDLSGKTVGNWAHWSRVHFSRLRKLSGLAGPQIVQAQNVFASAILLRVCEILRKTAPIFFARKLA